MVDEIDKVISKSKRRSHMHPALRQTLSKYDSLKNKVIAKRSRYVHSIKPSRSRPSRSKRMPALRNTYWRW